MKAAAALLSVLVLPIVAPAQPAVPGLLARVIWVDIKNPSGERG